jgi:hypothetical protein
VIHIRHPTVFSMTDFLEPLPSRRSLLLLQVLALLLSATASGEQLLTAYNDKLCFAGFVIVGGEDIGY